MKFLFGAVTVFLSALLLSQESITRFYADIEVDTSSVITVKENIDIISAGDVF